MNSTSLWSLYDGHELPAVVPSEPTGIGATGSL